MNILKKKYGVYIVLCTLIVTIGIFMMGSDDVFALSDTTGNPVVSSAGTTIMYWTGERSPIVKANNGNCLCFCGIPGTNFQYSDMYGLIIISNSASAAEMIWNNGSHVSGYEFSYNNKTYYGVFLGSNGRFGGSNDAASYHNPLDLPVFDFSGEGQTYIRADDGSLRKPLLDYIFQYWDVDFLLENGYTPDDPEYSYDENIGSLVDVEFKNVIDETGESNFLDISYSRYTSTGKDLSASGYGIMSRLVYNDPNNLDSIISFPEYLRPNITDSTGKKALKLITWGSVLYRNAIADSIADLFSESDFNNYRFDDNLSGGGGHSFDFSQMDPYYDVILTPYYYDGSDYYYGDNTVINGVYFDQLGTRLVDDPDSDQTISITNVTINNYDYGVESQYINNGEITNIDSLQVYNYTTYITDNSQNNIDNSINTTNNSTTNIYNSNNRYKPFNGKNLFQGVTAADLLTGLQSVITAFAMAFPIIGGLFDYLPWWAVDIAFTCTVVLAAMGTLKVLNIGNKINIGDLIGGGGS